MGDDDDLPRVGLYVLRVLRFAAERGLEVRLRDEGTMAELGLADWETLVASRPLLARRLRSAQRRAARSEGHLFRNVDRLAADLELAEAERALFAVAVAHGGFDALQSAVDGVRGLSAHRLLDLVARVADVPVAEARAALAPGRALVSLGLVRVRSRMHGGFVVELRDERLLRALCAPHPDSASLLAWLYPPVPEPTLGLADHDHLGDRLLRLVRVLDRALDQGTAGFDILLHGPPGTGKTELARLLVQQVRARGLEVASEDDDDDALRHDHRLGSWALCQRSVARASRCVVVFDEAEDAFQVDPLRRTHTSKGWINRALETHPVPTVWVANHVGQLDPAFLRRFDVVLEVGAPPRAVRRRIIEQRLGPLPVSARARDRLADDARATAAHLDRAARCVELLGPADAREADAGLAEFLEPQLDLLGSRPRSEAEVPFDAALASASVDLDRLADALGRSGRGNVLLHGPPGTGKTSWAHHVARRAGLPLHVRTAGDLLGPYVGVTERNLAAAFAEARGGVLLLDEVDSLLRDRAGARQSWEVSQVNELLVQLDRHDGIVICATNRLDDLDPAALRRFAVQVAFEAPGHDLRRRLVGEALRRLGCDDEGGWERAVDALGAVTPGDVAAAERRFELLGGTCARDLLDALAGARRPGPRPAGYR